MGAMNTPAKRFTDARLHPGVRLTRHLRLWIGAQEHDLDVLDFNVRGGFCKDCIPVLHQSDLTVNNRYPHTN